MADADTQNIPKKQPVKTISDIAKPSETTADATSRPVIQKNKQLAHDPMLNSKNTVDDSKNDSTESNSTEPKKDITPPSAARKTLQPLHSNSADNKPSHEVKEGNTEAGTTERSEPLAHQGAEVSAVADQLQSKKDEAKKDSDQTQDHAKINKLVAEKTYFLPIKTPRNKRKARVLMVVVVLVVLTGAGLYYANTLGYIPGA